MVAYVYKAVKQRHPVMDYYHVDLLAKSQKKYLSVDGMKWLHCRNLTSALFELDCTKYLKQFEKNISADVAQWVEIDADWEFVLR